MAVYSKERPELELESFFRSLYPSTRRGIRENWMRLREDPEISQWEIGEVDRIWIRLYRELVEQRPDLEPLFNEPRDLSRFPQKGGMRGSGKWLYPGKTTGCVTSSGHGVDRANDSMRQKMRGA